ncbi:YtxH domain-containing protein [Candidatus Woesebacteria bacterium]|nr:YtxH domain-containing protein [Candidatus Woesebacteria bacterium]
MVDHEDQNSPSFVTGFGLGLIVGAAGFVLFGTKKGSLLRQDLQKAFAAAYKEEIAAGEVMGEAISLRDFLSTAFSKVKEEIEIDMQAGRATTKSLTKSKVHTKSAKQKSGSTKSKFKNI